VCVKRIKVHTVVRKIKRGKCALYITMNNTTESAEKVIWTANQHMAYYNLPPMMVQHWSYVHDLNGYLMDIVRFLTRGYRTTTQPLNPLAPEYIYQRNGTVTGHTDHKTTDHETNQWCTTGGMFKQHHSHLKNKSKGNGNKNQNDSPTQSSSNRFKVLEEELGDVENDNTIVQSIAQDIKIEEITKKCDQINKKMERIQECYEVEDMTVQSLQALLSEYYNHHEKQIRRTEEEYVEVENLNHECLQHIACKEIKDAGERYDIAVNELETLQHEKMNAEEAIITVEKEYQELKQKHKNEIITLENEKFYMKSVLENYKRNENYRKQKYHHSNDNHQSSKQPNRRNHTRFKGMQN